MLQPVVSPALQPSSGPSIDLLKLFKAKWSKIDQTSYAVATDDENIRMNINSFKNDIITFALTKLSEEQPRDDYKELLELSIIYLGGCPRSGINFRKPGADGWQKYFIACKFGCLSVKLR